MLGTMWHRGRLVIASGLVLAAVMLSVSVAGKTHPVAGWLPSAARIVLAVAQAVLVLGRRRAPLAVLAATTGIAAVMIAGGLAADPVAAGPLVAAYTVGSLGQERPGDQPKMRRIAAGGGAALAAAVVLMTAMTLPGSRQRPSVSGAWQQIALLGAFVALAWVSGYAIGTRRAYVAELEERAARLEREEGERAASAVADERLRIARELHDVVGHSIGLITVQAEAAARSARTNPDAVPGFLATISSASRDALAEMRRLLAVLRPQDSGDSLEPQPGLETLPDLVAQVEAAGLPVRLVVQPKSLPPGVGLAVYRIVQEALTNTLKHAGPVGSVKASVLVAQNGEDVMISVLDDGRGPRGDPPPAAHGLVGMRERAAMYGGTLSAGAKPSGGFRVRAKLSLSAESSSAESSPAESSSAGLEAS